MADMGNHPIVLFDGVCNYCNRWINFSIKHDSKNKLRFAPLQSSKGLELQRQYGFPDSIDSVVVIDNNEVYTQSSAAFRIIKYLDWPAKFLIVLTIVPRFISDPVYKWIAGNRYKWFGKKDTCMIPSADVKARFLE